MKERGVMMNAGQKQSQLIDKLTKERNFYKQALDQAIKFGYIELSGDVVTGLNGLQRGKNNGVFELWQYMDLNKS